MLKKNGSPILTNILAKNSDLFLPQLFVKHMLRPILTKFATFTKERKMNLT